MKGSAHSKAVLDDSWITVDTTSLHQHKLYYVTESLKGTLSRCSARTNLTAFFHRKTIELSLCRIMPAWKLVTDKRYLYPIHHSHSSLNYRKKGQLTQLVRESDLFFRVKRQVKTVLTNVVVENMKSVHNKLEYADVQMLWCQFYSIYTQVLIIFTKQSW